MRGGRDHPSCRAVVRDGIVTLNPWRPWLLDAGPLAPYADELAEAGVVLADLGFSGAAPERELTVRFVVPGAGDAEAEDAPPSATL